MRRLTAALPIAIAGILLAVGIASCLEASRRRFEVPRLAFLGYTNKPLTLVTALVGFTNDSGLSLEILPQTRDENVIESASGFSLRTGLATVWPADLPKVVPPGGTAVLEISINDLRDPWWIEVATRPILPRSRLRDFAAGIHQPRLRRWAQQLFPPIETSWINLGPFSNLPPGWVRDPNGGPARRHSVNSP